jgi:hypothetical protein
MIQDKKVEVRVLEEKEQLDAKIYKLSNFLQGNDCQKLSYDDIVLLNLQLNCMKSYNSCLQIRIKPSFS